MTHPRAFLLAGFAALLAGPAHALTGGGVDPRFHGRWVPAKAGCASPLGVVVEAQKVTFANGERRQAFAKLEQCFACMGRDVSDVTILSTDAMGDSPWLLYLDGTTKPPSASADFNDRKLGAAFPLGTGKLKKCP